MSKFSDSERAIRAECDDLMALAHALETVGNQALAEKISWAVTAIRCHLIRLTDAVDADRKAALAEARERAGGILKTLLEKV